MRTIDTTVTIEASPQTVWEILVDFEAYQEWNPYIVCGAGTAQVGNRLSLELRAPGDRGRGLTPMVLVAEPGSHLQWRGGRGFPGLYAAWHEFLLEPQQNGPDGPGTVLRHREIARGLFAAARRGTAGKIEAGFLAMNDALKERAEQR